MIVIGISGKKRAGKDTFLEGMKASFSGSIARIAFADSLKEEVAAACGISQALLDANKETFRTIMQWWGTDFRRKLYNEDYWIEKVLLKLHNTKADIVVIPDVRFLNEAKMIDTIGGILIRINRPNLPVDNHPSETSLDNYINFHYVINNNKTIEDLFQKAQKLVSQF